MTTWETHLDKAERPSIEDLQMTVDRARHRVKKAREILELAEHRLDRVASAYSIECMRGV